MMHKQLIRLLQPKVKSCWFRIASQVHDWGYSRGVAPDQWHTIFPPCAGKNQSPVDIKTADVVYNPKLQNFDLKELGATENLKMVLVTNHGRSVQINLNGHNIKVNGGSLPGTYIVEQFHFHWGPKNHEGSEHTVDGKGFSSELHIVMHLDKYKNAGEALSHTNGLAVLGYLIDVGNHNKYYDNITDNLKAIKDQNDSIPLPSMNLTSLLSRSHCYYRYLGSMTTPPCASVIWTMFKEPIFLSDAQLNKFRELGDKHSSDMDLIHNCRKPQPLDGRIVTSNCSD